MTDHIIEPSTINILGGTTTSFAQEVAVSAVQAKLDRLTHYIFKLMDEEDEGIMASSLTYALSADSLITTDELITYINNEIPSIWMDRDTMNFILSVLDALGVIGHLQSSIDECGNDLWRVTAHTPGELPVEITNLLMGAGYTVSDINGMFKEGDSDAVDKECE